MLLILGLTPIGSVASFIVNGTTFEDQPRIARTNDDPCIHLGVLVNQRPNHIQRLIIRPLNGENHLVPLARVVERERGFEVVVQVRVESAQGPDDGYPWEGFRWREVPRGARFMGESFFALKVLAD